MANSLRQAWWAPVAALLVLGQLALAVGSALVAHGALFGVFWFWSLVLPLLGIVVLVGLVITEVRARQAATTT